MIVCCLFPRMLGSIPLRPLSWEVSNAQTALPVMNAAKNIWRGRISMDQKILGERCTSRREYYFVPRRDIWGQRFSERREICGDASSDIDWVGKEWGRYKR